MRGETKGTRVIALVGPTGAGKTELAEAMLFASGAIGRQGHSGDGNSVGDSSPEARARGGSTEANLTHFTYLDEHYALLDAPGAIGFSGEASRAVALADAAIVVVDPDPARAALAAPALRMLDEQGIPHLVFVNRIDQAQGSLQQLLRALQPMSVSPLIARQIPIRDGEKIDGFVDLALERAFHYVPGKPSEQIEMPSELAEREAEARTAMLEQLADHDDALLEQLLMDETPTPATIFADLAHETEDNLGVSMLFGSAINGWGVRRLLKALRHEAPGPEKTARRLGVETPSLFPFKASHAGAVGRLLLARVIGGSLSEGQDLKDRDGESHRLGAMFAVMGDKTAKLGQASDGELVAVAKMDGIVPGDWLSAGALPPKLDLSPPARNCAYAIEPADRKDDVRLSGALAKLIEEDWTLSLDRDEDSHEMRLRGVNDEHLQTTLARLKRRYGVEVTHRPPTLGYRESIRKPVGARGRHKKQSGGHGQFGDVVIEIRPRGRGDGFAFSEKIHGGAIPKQYIPAVEQGVKDALAKGPMGFPVVDVEVVLTDGSFHSVDSSELAFRLAGRLAMQDALGQAGSYLLEPMQRLVVVAPAAASSRVSSALASRRGQVMGMGPRDGWQGWDRIEVVLPEAELGGLEAELRSLSQGLASYDAQFDHLSEVSGHLADKVVAKRHAEPA